jgi:hypothetical protein
VGSDVLGLGAEEPVVRELLDDVPGMISSIFADFS